jgi:hypothetical protein
MATAYDTTSIGVDVLDDNSIERSDLSTRLAGFGAITFVVVVIIQNLIRGASAPQNGAATADVVRYYTDHRGLTVLLSATFVIGGLALAAFLGGAMRRLVTGPGRGWAYTGFAGAIGIMVLFASEVATDGALSVLGGRAKPSASAIDALWALHNSLFTVLFLAIGIALVGLGRAGVAAGITPRAFKWIAPTGLALLALASAAGPLIAAGQAMPMFGLGGLGFLAWLAYLATTGSRLIRT